MNGKQGYTFVVDLADGEREHGEFHIRIFKNGVLMYDSNAFAAGLLEEGNIKLKR